MTAKVDATLVDVMETVRQLVAEQMLAQWDDLRSNFGDRPAFTVDLTKAEQALRQLAEWFVYGNADLPVSVPYWTYKAKQFGLPGPPDWKAAGQFDRAMRKLNEDPRYEELKWKGADDQTGFVYAHLRAMGLHTGHVQPVAADAEGSDDGAAVDLKKVA